MQLLTLLALVTPAVALIATTSKPATSALSGVKSASLPFLDRPAKLDGSMIGDVGFDPLGLTEILPNLKYVREAEIKHGRVAMLATVGFVFQQFHHPLLPDISNPLQAVGALGLGPQLQVLLGIGAIELGTWNGVFAGKSEPGDYGFDPLKQLKGKSAAEIDTLKLKELKNGRLAMIASIGMVVENLLFDGRPTIAF